MLAFEFGVTTLALQLQGASLMIYPTLNLEILTSEINWNTSQA